MENRKRVLTAVLLGVILLLVLAAVVAIPLLARQSEQAATPLTQYWVAVQRPENAITNQPGSKAFLFAQKYAMLYQKQLRPGAAEKGV